MDEQKEAASILEHTFDVYGHAHILQSLVFQTQVVDIVVFTLTQFITAVPLSTCYGPQKMLFATWFFYCNI